MATTDTHALFKLLKDSGIQEEYAEVVVTKFVSRDELKELENDRLSSVTKADLKVAISEVRADLIQWMVGLFIGNMALIMTSSFFIINFLKK